MSTDPSPPTTPTAGSMAGWDCQEPGGPHSGECYFPDCDCPRERAEPTTPTNVERQAAARRKGWPEYMVARAKCWCPDCGGPDSWHSETCPSDTST